MSTHAKARSHLIFVDDEAHLCSMIADYLKDDGDYSVRTASCGVSLDRLLAEQEADLIVLDINMPGEDGLSILRRLRARRGPPVVMLTAESNIADKIAGLEIGADDYMTKPFDLRELKARIRAVLRRSGTAGPGLVAPSLPGLTPRVLIPFGRLSVDRDARLLIRADGTPEPVTAMELDLIDVFLKNPDRVLTRDRLLDLAHHRGNDPFDRSIDVRITRIRKKIEQTPSRPEVLKTVRGVGYIYTPGRR